MIKIRRLNQYPPPEELRQIVQAYRLIFGSEPWNEGYKCPLCEATYPISNSPLELTCPKCNKAGRQILMIDYWPEATVISDFYNQMMKKSARCFVAEDNKKIIGFAWGYEIIINQQTSNYLEASGLTNLLEVGKVHFYGDETAVLKEYCHQGIGTRLTKELFTGEKNILLRTLAGSTMHHIINRLGGEIILPISRERIIMRLCQ